jgi:hypothetical protein
MNTISMARIKSSKNDDVNPSFDTATCGSFQAQFWQAMHTKLYTLTKKFDC